MKVEFLVALTDHTWHTKIVDVPDKEMTLDPSSIAFDSEALMWALEHISQFDGDIALIAVYCSDPESEAADDPRLQRDLEQDEDEN